MKNKKAIAHCYFLIFVVSVLFIQNLFSQQRIEGEIQLGVIGIGDQDQWYYEWVAYVIPRWWSDYYLTNNYYSGETPTFTGNYNGEPQFALSSPSSPGEHNIAWGYYKFTFKIPDNSFSKILYLDLRDANWCINPPYPSDPDTKIRWNHGIQKFEFKNKVYTNWTSFSAGSAKTIWGFFNISTPKQDVFQPTPPRYFQCTNPNQTGAHPHFAWSSPSWPGDVEKEQILMVYYWVYRNGSCVAKNLTSCNWTDTRVTISPNGSNLTYFVKAKLAYSPFSDASNSVIVKGNLLQHTTEEPSQESDVVAISNADYSISTSAFPNPFNLATTIKFEIPKDGYIKLEIYNILGERIIALVEGEKQAGVYEITWDGKNIDGVVMPSGVYVYILTTNEHREAKKMILAK